MNKYSNESVVEPVTLEWDGLDCLNDFWGLHIAECEYVNAPTRYQLRFHSWDFGDELDTVDECKSLAARLQAVLDSPTEPKEA